MKKAFESAEQEIQDKNVARFKEIVLDLLEKKKVLEEDKNELEKEIKVIRQALDDFKEGRIDKVKEMLDKNEIARKVIPIKITIIQNEIYNNYPLNPWKWNYQIVSQPYYGTTTLTSQYATGAGTTGYYTTSATSIPTNAVMTLTGTTATNFTGGTYYVNGQPISL